MQMQKLIVSLQFWIFGAAELDVVNFTKIVKYNLTAVEWCKTV